MSVQDTEQQTNLAAVLKGIDQLVVEHYETGLAPVGADEVRVAMKAVGICGSDVHYLKHGRIADFVVRAPMVIGHESAGVVTEVGSNVKHLQVGDHVALEPGVPCRVCKHCKTGLYNLCKDIRFFATPPHHGSLAQYITHPADMAFKLPPGVSLEEGAMCEPLSVAVHACRRADVQPGKTVLVTGAGPIGLVTLLVAKAFGASRVIVTDVCDSRLKLAAGLGASQVVNVHGEQLEEVVREVTEGGGEVDVAVDCAGFNDTVKLCLSVITPGGKVCLVGMGCSGEMKVPLAAGLIKEIDLVGVFRYRNTYPTCLELIRSGAVDVKPLITHRIDLSSVERFTEDAIRGAFEASAKGGAAVKVMFNL